MDNTELNKSRADFEAWAMSGASSIPAPPDLSRLAEGYARLTIEIAWRAWQTALARAGSAAPAGQQAEPVATIRHDGTGWDAAMTEHGYRLCGSALMDGAALYAAPIPTKEGAGEVDASRLLALHAAVSALYFDDSSDFRSALGTVVRHLDPELAGELLAHPEAAYDKACAMSIAAQPKDTTDTKEKANG